MLIVCPTCASEYRIDAARVGTAGRSVRCAACRETWFLTPADVAAAREAELAAAAEEAGPDAISDAAWQEAAEAVRATAAAEAAVPEEPRPARRRAPRASKPAGRRRASPVLTPALALALAALAAVPLACLARASVVRLVPQTAVVFAGLGLPVNLRGIEIRDVVAFSNPDADGHPAELVVEGDLVGIGRTDVPVAALAVEVRDAAGRTVRTFPVTPPRAVLGAGQTARFRASLPAPPAQGRAVELRFADAGPAPGTRVASAGR